RLAEDGGRALVGRNVVGEDEGAKVTPRPTNADSAVPGADRSYTPVEEALGGAIAKMVKPVVRRGTRLIDVYVTHTDPVIAQRLAEAIGREYIRFAVDRRSSSTNESLRYLMEEEERLKTNLRKSEAAIAEYKANTPDALQLGGGAASTGSQQGAGSSGGRGGLVEERLQDLTNRLSAARADRVKLEGELAQVEQAENNVEALLAIPGVATSPAVNDRRRDVAQLEATVATLEQRYKEKHPKMIAARAALTEAQAALRREAVAAPAVLRNMLEQARTAEANLESTFKEQERAALALNKAAIGYQELARQAETDRALYESVLKQIAQTDLTKGVRTSAVTVVERPQVPAIPVSPKPKKSVALGLLGGLAAGLGVIFGLNTLDRTVKTVDEAENLFGVPVLAAVPETAGAKSAKGAPSDTAKGIETYRLVAEAPEGPAAEAFRSLRATITLLGRVDERKVFLFTSALPSEGKSFTSANYALSLAQQGHRVLLIDGDLRRPTLHHIFRHTDHGHDDRSGGMGIVDCLVGESTLDEAIGVLPADQLGTAEAARSRSKRIETAMGGQLSVLAAGSRAPNPAELLSGSAFAELVREASGMFDRIVIDSAPILAVSDTLLMAPHAQTTCLVVRAAKTSRDAVRRALGLLEGANSRPAGIVLNRLPKRSGTGHYYYYNSPGYGAGTYGGHYGDRQPAGAARGSNGA
ncbi:MAG TPA: polysaccharide biosynthesis tyrosine autokinase, partial [Chthoniobacterales bacterium]|nr:polysaccharide biosynthesis tyrosine autokinase [Chthoniobacterales bacterium]